MTVLPFLVRSIARGRWRAWVVVALLVGCLSGLAMSAAAGARRTNSVVDRARHAQRSFDVFMAPAYTENGERLDFDKIAAFPEVVEAVRTPMTFLTASPGGYEAAVNVMFSGHEPRVVSGELQQRRNDVVVNVLARDAFGLRPGKSVRGQFTPLEGEAGGDGGYTASLRVTGVVSNIGDFGGDAEPTIWVTPEFWGAHNDDIGSIDLFMFRLRNGAADYGAFHSRIDALVGAPVLYLESTALDDQIRRSFGLQASALSILAAFLAVTALLIGSQLVIRVVHLESADYPTLRALGVGNGDLAGVGLARALVIAIGASATAVAVAFGLSRLFPLGDPGLAEPSPGPRADVAVFVGGTLVVTVVLGLVSLFALRSGRGGRLGSARGSALAALFSRVLPGPAAAVGARMALEPGTRSSVPVRSTFASAALAVGAVVIALSVGASLNRLLDTPRLYGWDWDVIVGGFDQTDIDGEQLGRVSGVDTFSTGVTGMGGQVLVNGREAAATALGSEGGVTPPLLEGRIPGGSREVALAARTFRQSSAKLGDTVRARFPGIGREATFRVVGIVVLPFTGDNTSLGEGAFFTMDGARRMFADIPSDSAFIRFEATANPRDVIANLRRAFPEHEVFEPRTPLTLLDFGNVRSFPLIVASVVGALALGTLLHLLSSSIRAARRDLAVVKSMGASRRQLRSIVAWQSSIVVVVAVLIGAPIGLAAGRWLWILLARTYGFIAAPAVPLAEVGAMTIGALVFANLAAAMPGRTAARVPAALVLRTE